MDNLTHTLAGLMMSRAGIDRKIPRAAAIMTISANIPDIDVVSLAGGPLAYLQWHRSYAHSLICSPLMALLSLLIVFAIWRTPFSWLAYFYALLGVLSHLALDWTNTYGIRLFLPFSEKMPRLDVTSVIDPWIWCILLLAVAAPALSRMVGVEIGSKKSAGPKRAWAWIALVALCSYEGARYAAHARALALMNTRLFNGAVPRRLAAIPGANPLRWRGIAEGGDFVAILPMDLTAQFDPSAARIDYPAPSGPAIEAAKRTRAFQVFGAFSQLPFWKITSLADAKQVELIDLRFGTPERPGFEARAVVDSTGAVRQSRFTFGGP
ncbi:MAG: metal-dependent hydrolase [Bryobacteraceae bacterium]